ncbi:MAG: lysylphosphatidylglycerol synthase transmembrane domain-containing protein [Bryobacteraceae bacterium]
MSANLSPVPLPAEVASPPPRSRLIYWLIALALAGVFLFFSLRGIEWGQVWRILSRADLKYIALCLAMGSFALFLRAVRWRILLCSGAPVDIPTAFWATAAGYFGNNFLPARAGELVRTMMISARCGLSKTFVLTTALSERLSDAIALVIISSVVLLTLPVRPGWFDRAARPFAIIGLAGALAIALVPRLERLWKYFLSLIPLPDKIRVKVIHILEQMLIGARAFHDIQRLLGFMALTLVIWLSDGVATQIGMHAIGFTIGLPVALLLITGLALGSALPSTPGYVGIYQFVAVSVLVPFGFSRTDAIAYIILAQALQYFFITFWGAIGLARARRLNFRAAPASSA